MLRDEPLGSGIAPDARPDAVAFYRRAGYVPIP